MSISISISVCSMIAIPPLKQTIILNCILLDEFPFQSISHIEMEIHKPLRQRPKNWKSVML